MGRVLVVAAVLATGCNLVFPLSPIDAGIDTAIDMAPAPPFCETNPGAVLCADFDDDATGVSLFMKDITPSAGTLTIATSTVSPPGCLHATTGAVGLGDRAVVIFTPMDELKGTISVVARTATVDCKPVVVRMSWDKPAVGTFELTVKATPLGYEADLIGPGCPFLKTALPANVAEFTKLDLFADASSGTTTVGINGMTKPLSCGALSGTHVPFQLQVGARATAQTPCEVDIDNVLVKSQ